MEVQRLLCFEVGGEVIRRQPPVRVVFCETPFAYDPAKLWLQCPACLASSDKCPRCLFAYCPSHLREHTHFLSAPPDSWKTVVRKMIREYERRGGTGRFLLPSPGTEPIREFAAGSFVASRRPPARVEYCTTPTTGKVGLPCGHRSAACQPGSETCPHCLFTYCPKHLAAHVRRFAWPLNDWRDIVVGFGNEKAKAVGNPRHAIRVEVPRLKPSPKSAQKTEGNP